jgi:hypothetical protein
MSTRVGSKEASEAVNHLYAISRKARGILQTSQGQVDIDGDVHESATNAFRMLHSFIEQHSQCGLRSVPEEVADASPDDEHTLRNDAS